MLPPLPLAPDLALSRLALGLWRIDQIPDSAPRHLEHLLETCLEVGVTTLDSADIYAAYTADASLGTVLRQRPALRDAFTVVGKCDIVAPIGRHAQVRNKYYDTSAGYVRGAVERCLQDLGTDRLDVLLLHRPDPLLDAAETGAALDALVQEGKVRAVGTSNFRPWDVALLQSAMRTPLAIHQIELSLQHPDPFTNGDLAFHQQHQHVVMAWSPLGGGTLLQGEGLLQQRLDTLAAAYRVDRAAMALAFLLRHPARILPVLGTMQADRLRLQARACSVVLDRADWFWLYEAALGREVP